jgi:hypothetical protein
LPGATVTRAGCQWWPQWRRPRRRARGRVCGRGPRAGGRAAYYSTGSSKLPCGSHGLPVTGLDFGRVINLTCGSHGLTAQGLDFGRVINLTDLTPGDAVGSLDRQDSSDHTAVPLGWVQSGLGRKSRLGEGEGNLPRAKASYTCASTQRIRTTLQKEFVAGRGAPA